MVKAGIRHCRHLVSNTDVLQPVHLAHPGKLYEAAVVKVVLYAQVVAVPEKRQSEENRFVNKKLIQAPCRALHIVKIIRM